MATTQVTLSHDEGDDEDEDEGDDDHGTSVWVREVLQSGYTPFSGWVKSGDATPSTQDAVSAEMYCSSDVLNYDNYDRIDNVKKNTTYYCVAFNAAKPATLTVKKVVVGGTKTASDFAFSINNTTPIQFEADGQNDVALKPGTYSVSELSTPANYAASYSGCSDIVLGPDGKATCTITNTYVAPPPPQCNANATHTVVSDTTTKQGASLTVSVDIDLGTDGNQIHSYWTANIPDAQWIWGENPVNTPDQEINETFTKTFTIVGTPNAAASLMIAADNSYSVDVNGHTAVCADATEDNFSTADTCPIPQAYLLSGTNTLTFHVKNWAQTGGTPQSNPAGLLYKLTYTANECSQSTVCEASVNLVKNGSFESPLVTGNGGTWDLFANATPLLEWMSAYVSGNTPSLLEIQRGYSGWNASDGAQFAELDSNEPTVIYQDIPTVPGATYTFSFDYAARPDASTLADNAMTVSWGGTAVVATSTDKVSTGPNTYWVPSSYTVTATTTTTRIAFTDTGTANTLGNFVDHVSVTCQPEALKATVTLCKYNTKEQALPGWTMMLKGDKVEDLIVPANTSAGINTLASLNAGQSYLAVAKGTWNNQGGANPVDPEYSTTDGWLSQMDGYTGYGAGILELEINQTDGAWGPYSATHEYAQAFVPGVNGSANFRIFDGDTGTHTQNEGWFGDNTGSLDVSVYKGYAGVTGENGCVTFTNVPYGAYSVDELLKQNWSNQSGLGSVTIDAPTETLNVVNKDTSVPTTATVIASKVECVAEEYLPNWGAGGADITAQTAQAWVDQSNGTCKLVDWTFQWAPSVAANPGDNTLGLPSGWTAFSSGVATSIPAGALLWVREQVNSLYVPFSGQNTTQAVSAELYCSTDVLNYDNFDWINPVEEGKTYYCVGFNAPKQHVEEEGGTLTIVKKTVGGNGTFTFTVGDGEDVVTQPQIATEDGTGTTSVDGLEGSYTVVESVPSGWTLTSVSCEYDNESVGEQIVNGESITLDAGDHVTCTFTNTKNSTDGGNPGGENPPTPPGGGGGGNPSFATFGGGGAGPIGGRVLGASCGLYMDKHIKFGSKKNDVEQVKKLQLFLNKELGLTLAVTGVYDQATYAAVLAFQKKYADNILKPWGIGAPTGLVYLSTLYKINLIQCPELALQLPPLVPWSKNPKAQ